MATKEKKVILFLVEGISDEVSLQAIFDDYYDMNKVKISVVHCDITQNEIPSEIKTKLNTKVQEFCAIERFKVSDIKQIIQIVDTDGTFVPDENVRQKDDNSNISYTENIIETKNRKAILERNQNKTAVLNLLSKMIALTVSSGTMNYSVPYSVFYFSRNLEHVLHNISRNLTDQEKEDLSNQFDDHYDGDSEKFKKFISDPVFAAPGDYKETWEFIKQETNSLKRYTNLHLLFR